MGIGRRILIIGIAGAAALMALAGPGGGALRAAAATPPGFGEPTPATICCNGFESDLRLDYSGTNQIAYESAPQSLSSTISTVQRSLDSGLTWKLVPGQDSGSSGGKNNTCPAGGGDSELDTAAGKLYFTDLTLANYSVARSDDKGTTFNAGTNCAGVIDAGVDRPWLTHLGDPTNGGREFMVYDESPGTAAIPACGSPASGIGGNILVVAVSPVPMAPGATAGVQYTNSLGLSCDEGIMGNDEVFDYGVAGGGGKFYVVHDNAALTSISVVRCDIVPQTVTNTQGLSNCADHLVSSFPGSVTGANFPTMTVDNHGNLFTVWEQAPGSTGAVTGNTALLFSTSMNQGTSWSSPAVIPTAGLLQHVMAWPGAGDSGRIDVAYYGAPEAWAPGDIGGPDSINGHYGLYLSQTTNNGLSWTPPVLASEHFIHYGTMYTLIGNQTGNRTLGDFFQLRIGPQGEANMSFSDSNNRDSGFNPEPMFVRQISGSSVFAAQNGTGNVSLPAPPPSNCAGDPLGDATFDAVNTVGANNPNLDLTGMCMSKPDAAHYQVVMNIANLTSLTPGPGAGGTTLIWQTQWHTPSSADHTNGGALFMVYAESVGGQAPTCWAGQNASTAVGGGVQLTYPGTTQLTGTACAINQPAGTITITVPISTVSVASPDSSILYSVTASTQTLPAGNAETPPPTAGLGGVLFNIIDVAQSFDFNPAVQTCQGPACNVPEAPLVPLLVLLPASVVGAIGLRRRRRSHASEEVAS